MYFQRVWIFSSSIGCWEDPFFRFPCFLVFRFNNEFQKVRCSIEYEPIKEFSEYIHNEQFKNCIQLGLAENVLETVILLIE